MKKDKSEQITVHSTLVLGEIDVLNYFNILFSFMMQSKNNFLQTNYVQVPKKHHNTS